VKARLSQHLYFSMVDTVMGTGLDLTYPLELRGSVAARIAVRMEL
jgi:hypothetical protein